MHKTSKGIVMFIGREEELLKLKNLSRKQIASFVVVKGRRRIGKSRLIAEYCKGKETLNFIGIPPTKKTTARHQRKNFKWQLEKQTGLKDVKFSDWNDLFFALFEQCANKKIVIVLDEISWIGSRDPNFLGKLKTAWDMFFSQNPNLILIVCGSVSSWIEKNILSSTGFVGRISSVLHLKELSLKECAQFWKHPITSAYEMFKILSITGGIPKYLEEVDPLKSAEHNITSLCYDTAGFLFNEFETLFSDLFSKKNPRYRQILETIVEKKCNADNIFKALGVKKSGYFKKYFSDLEAAGFIERDYMWHLATGKQSKLSYFRIKDNYARFYLKHIEPNKDRIEKGTYRVSSISDIAGWSSFMGLQFENLVLSNRKLIIERLGINPSEVLYDNPYLQRATNRKSGCQVDYMIQTKFNTLYLCEIKFSKNPIGSGVIEEVLAKINALAVPKRVSIKPILIHVNGITEDLEDRKFFAEIIDFGALCFGW
jgi:AAA+ ATPase superfamily predicted ATPase